VRVSVYVGGDGVLVLMTGMAARMGVRSSSGPGVHSTALARIAGQPRQLA
jgi:hypothetical protein